MDWTECIDRGKVKEVRKNPEQARSLVEPAKKRLESIEKRKDYEYPQLLIEDYYETIKELLSALIAVHVIQELQS
ncbi:MAG: hypothetical protein ACE5KV_07555 [Thermoplasmata archaeon]